MTTANPFLIDVEALPEAVRTSARDCPDAKRLDLARASRLAEEIIAFHEERLRGERTPLPIGNATRGDQGRVMVAVTGDDLEAYYVAKQNDRRPLGRWKRSPATSRQAWELIEFHGHTGLPPRALLAVAHALGIAAAVERRATGDALTQRAGRMRAAGVEPTNTWLANRSGLSVRGVQELRNDHEAVADRIDAVEQFWRGVDQGQEACDLAVAFHAALHATLPEGDPPPSRAIAFAAARRLVAREKAVAFNAAVPHERQALPPDAAGRVVAAMGGTGAQQALGRLVAYHLAAAGPLAPTSRVALAYALGLARRTKARYA